MTVRGAGPPASTPRRLLPPLDPRFPARLAALPPRSRRPPSAVSRDQSAVIRLAKPLTRKCPPTTPGTPAHMPCCSAGRGRYVSIVLDCERAGAAGRIAADLRAARVRGSVVDPGAPAGHNRRPAEVMREHVRAGLAAPEARSCSRAAPQWVRCDEARRYVGPPSTPPVSAVRIARTVPVQDLGGGSASRARSSPVRSASAIGA